MIVVGSAAPAIADDSGPSLRIAPGAQTESVTVSGPGEAQGPDPEIIEGVEEDVPLEEDLPLPGEVDGPQLDDNEASEVSASGGDRCVARGFFHISRNLKNTMAVKYHVVARNKKDYSISFKFTSKKSGTTTIGASVTVSGETKVMLLGAIKVEVNASVEKSWTSELGVEVSGKVKAHSAVFGDYGIMKENISGYTAYRYSNCTVGQKKNMTVWAPYREGWTIS
ncbi:hypothetical protein ACFUJY_24280 [Streptomyces sp. NPDC057249]|uniref:hypothetical protein n=1 Tax=Streptomyces sp. NPDC057249 TaxID=3346067 RepID=UPI0036333A61